MFVEEDHATGLAGRAETVSLLLGYLEMVLGAGTEGEGQDKSRKGQKGWLRLCSALGRSREGTSKTWVFDAAL